MLMPLVGGRYAENGTTQDYLIIIAPEKVMKKRKKQQKKKKRNQTNKINGNITQNAYEAYINASWVLNDWIKGVSF